MSCLGFPEREVADGDMFLVLTIYFCDFLEGSTVKNQAIVQRTPATQIPPTVNSAQSTFTAQSQNIFLYVGLIFIALIT